MALMCLQVYNVLLYVQYMYIYILDSVSLSICASTDAEETLMAVHVHAALM